MKLITDKLALQLEEIHQDLQWIIQNIATKDDVKKIIDRIESCLSRLSPL